MKIKSTFQLIFACLSLNCVDAYDVTGWGANESGQLSPPKSEINVRSIAAGDQHSLCLRWDGTVFAFGNNDAGQLSIPVGLSNVVSIAAGRNHNLALTANGKVVAWGGNDLGQVNVPNNLSDVVKISAHESSSLALLKNGTLVGWGDNRFGQIPPTMSADSIVSISQGIHHTLALRSDGKVLAWGENDAGQVSVPANLVGVRAIAAGFKYSLALKSDGTVVAWGSNNYGQIQVPSGLSNVVSISAGHFHALALKADRTVISWGLNQSGQTRVPSGLTNVLEISAGGGFSLALNAGAIPFTTLLKNGLVANYPFNGDTKDASGNGLDGVEYHVKYTTNRFGIKFSAALFQEYSIANSVATSKPVFKASQSDFAVFAWVCFPDIKQTNSIGTVFNTRPHTGFALINSPNHPGDIRFSLGDGKRWNSIEQYPGISGWSENNWKHIGFVKNGDLVSMYSDGGLISSTLSPNVFAVDAGLLIGSADPSNQPDGEAGYNFHGIIDDVRIYSRALSDGEVAALYQYESVPQKSDPRQATATATVVNGFVVGATITDGGSGYTKVPSVVISGGGGTGATATATIDANGTVTGINIVSSGSKYTGIPTITIDPPPFPPSQAKGTATLINGFVTGVNITDTGHGYEGVIPPVTFLGGGGSGAKGTAIVSNGMVTGISMTASGSGYTNAPYVLIAAPPGLASADIAVKTVEVTLHLIPGYTYKIQTTTDAGNSWIDVESGILAVDKTLVRSFDVTTNTQLFRVVQVN